MKKFALVALLIAITATVLYAQQANLKTSAAQKFSTWTGTLTKLSQCLSLKPAGAKTPSLPESVPKIKNDSALPAISPPQICYQLTTSNGQNHYLLFPMHPALPTDLPAAPNPPSADLVPKPSLPSGPLSGGPAPSLPTNLPRPPPASLPTPPGTKPDPESDFGKPIAPTQLDPDSFVGKTVTISGVELKLKPTFILVLLVT